MNTFSATTITQSKEGRVPKKKRSSQMKLFK